MKAYRFYEQFLINRERRFIYCFVPKVACSSLKRWFVRVAGVSPADVAPNIHVFVANNFSLERLPRREADKFLRSKDYYRFAFVRNPFARLVSAYLNKIVVPEGPGLAPIKRVQRGRIWELRKRLPYVRLRLSTGSGADFQQGITFREFVHHVAHSTSPGRLDTHWRPQSLLLGEVEYDFLGLMENMRPDFEQVCRDLGLESDLPVTNNSRIGSLQGPTDCYADWSTSNLRALDSYPPFERFYTPELKEVVHRLYRQDWDAFVRLSRERLPQDAARLADAA